MIFGESQIPEEKAVILGSQSSSETLLDVELPSEEMGRTALTLDTEAKAVHIYGRSVPWFQGRWPSGPTLLDT